MSEREGGREGRREGATGAAPRRRGTRSSPPARPPVACAPPRSFKFLQIVELLNIIYCMAELLEFVAFLHLRFK